MNGTYLNLGAAGGLAITKTVTGHALAKEQFEFKVKAVKTDTATADEAAELVGFKEGETQRLHLRTTKRRQMDKL